MKRAFVIVCALAAAACNRADKAPADSLVPVVPPPTFAKTDFAKLRWLEGAWRGTISEGSFFYESYHFVNDTTLVRATHTDSTFKTKSDSAVMYYRDGAVVDSSAGSLYHAMKLDSTEVDFRLDADPRRHFTWTRNGADAWTAKIFSRTREGVERVTVYPMARMKK